MNIKKELKNEFYLLIFLFLLLFSLGFFHFFMGYDPKTTFNTFQKMMAFILSMMGVVLGIISTILFNRMRSEEKNNGK